MRKPLLLVPALAIASALALAACGGGEGDEDKIVAAIETSATSTDPADCTTFATRKFLEQTEGEDGAAAQDSCEEDAEDEAANDTESVDVTNVDIDGSSATADAAVTGGSFDGQEFTIALVEDGGDWKLDEITDFLAFDKEKLIAGFEDSLEAPESELERPQIECVVATLSSTPSAELEEVILTGQTTSIFGTIISGCSSA